MGATTVLQITGFYNANAMEANTEMTEFEEWLEVQNDPR
jgi:hypothetical protein